MSEQEAIGAARYAALVGALQKWASRSKTGYYDEAQDDVMQILRTTK